MFNYKIVLFIFLNFFLMSFSFGSVNLKKNNNNYFQEIKKKYNLNQHNCILKVNHLYNKAKKYVFEKKYTNAITILNDILVNYPCNETFDKQIKLILIYCYFKNEDLFLSLDLINSYVKQYIFDKNIEYLMYLHGLIYFKLSKNFCFIKSLFLNCYDYNFNYLKISYKNFLNLINAFPKSIYYLNSIKRMHFIKDKILQHELNIIQYYYKRNAYIAVINRI